MPGQVGSGPDADPAVERISILVVYEHCAASQYQHGAGEHEASGTTRPS